MSNESRLSRTRSRTMLICFGALSVCALVGSAGALGHIHEPGTKGTEVESKEKDVISKDVLGYKMKMIDGTMKSLEDYRGSVILIVNVASACGLTPQYEGLEELYKTYKDQDFVVIGFPSNDFGAQEPGTDEQIHEFCTGTYDVTFPMMSKIKVKGKGSHALYKQLAGQEEPIGGEPEWNFTKFLVNKEGEVVNRFSPRMDPLDKEVLKEIKALIEKD